MSTGPTSADTASPLAHQPALDGIRALAVIAVMLFHAGLGWTHAGFLGVDVFLVLSGFLITLLLLREISSTRHVDVRAFWLRRARRLLPALVLVLIAVACFGAFVATDEEALGLRGDLFGSLFYVQNWRLVLSGQPYFAQFGSPSPLRHMWSLAIEEQWYLVWPLAFLGIVRVARAKTRVIAAVIAALAVISAALMTLLYTPGGDALRSYYGTDTRAQALLIGALLAVGFSVRSTEWTRAWRLLFQTTGAGGLVFIAWVVGTKSETWPRLYRGGFTLIAIASAAIIAGAMVRGPLRRVLSLPPLPAVGRISYGLYLWHWPIYVWLSPDRTGRSGNTLLALRLALTLIVALVSYHFVERPIREQRFRIVRNRIIWVPAVLAVTSVALFGLTASGAAARTRPNIFAEIRRRLNAPPLPGATRVLVAGDSIAFTLVTAKIDDRDERRVWNRGVTIIGCGIVTGVPLSRGVDGTNQDHCAEWAGQYAAGVKKYRPQVATLLLGGWELFDRKVNGQTLRVGTPAMEQYLRTELDRARTILTAGGASLALLTTPCLSVATRDLGAWGEAERADPKRIRWLNHVWARYATDHPADVQLLDLAAIACPHGKFAAKIDGVTMRTDGEHFTPEGARVIWRWLAPQLHRIAKTAPPVNTAPPVKNATP